jgi:hypothetical protein
MNALAKMMLEMAARLIEEARKLSAPETDTRTFFTDTRYDGSGWISMLEQFAKEDALRGKLPFDPSLRAGIMGIAGGSPHPRSWETHKRIMDAAERGELNNDIAWPGPDGQHFNRWEYLSKSTVEKHDALVFLWYSPLGVKWRADPLNSGVCPKGEPKL